METSASDKDRKLAQLCLRCPVCKHARRRQRGFAFWLVKNVEGSICPCGKAYERVYGRKAHEPLPIPRSSAATKDTT